MNCSEWGFFTKHTMIHPPIIVNLSSGPPLFSKKNGPGPPHDFPPPPPPHINNNRSLKLSKFLALMGYHVYHILFTHSDMLRIRLSHKIEALYPVASICHLTNVPSTFGFSVPYRKLFSFTRFWCLWSWTTIRWMMGILLTPRHLPLLLLC